MIKEYFDYFILLWFSWKVITLCLCDKKALIYNLL